MLPRTVYVYLVLAVTAVFSSNERSFIIDYDNNTFLKDGQPFRWISGSMHYFQIPQIYWEDRMKKMAYAGLNAVQTYIEWGVHEAEQGVWDFSGNNDFISFIQEAQKQELLVILRPGPYICAARDMGGLPYWLLSIDPEIKLRTSDSTYMKHVGLYLDKILPMIKPLLYENGGPVIALQVENEYGSYYACDYTYMQYLRKKFRDILGSTVVLFTTDGNGDYFLKCGKITRLYATVDFGSGEDTVASFAAQRNHEPFGPLVNSEFYPGWDDFWGHPHNTANGTIVAAALDAMLQLNASVNTYLFTGGTSFGFSTGSVDAPFCPYTTSADYDAPISEAGDLTPKFFLLRDVIGKYSPLPSGPPPLPQPKYRYGTFTIRKVESVLQLAPILDKYPVTAKYPVSFEDLKQRNGFLLYQTTIGLNPDDPAGLLIQGLRDRAYIYVNGELMGILDRRSSTFALPIRCRRKDKLGILVENQGRIDYGSNMADRKGIISNVTVDGQILSPWTIFRLPMNDTQLIQKYWRTMKHSINTFHEPTFYVGDANFTTGDGHPHDTFLDTQDWTKGVAFINGFNLGRYWPALGPTRTLYVPKNMLNKNGRNVVILLELEDANCDEAKNLCSITFTDSPVLDTQTPTRQYRPTSLNNRFWMKKHFSELVKAV